LLTETNAFNSAVHPEGVYAAVFERDEGTAYLYLMDLTKPVGDRIVSALPLPSIEAMNPSVPTSMRWADRRKVAGLFVEGRLIALFDLETSLAAPGRMASPGDEFWFTRDH
jgi:hypothetical protein